MKFVTKTDTLHAAQEIKSLLENACIPVSISNKGFARLHVHFIPDMQTATYNAMNRLLLGMVVFGTILGLLLYGFILLLNPQQ